MREEGRRIREKNTDRWRQDVTKRRQRQTGETEEREGREGLKE